MRYESALGGGGNIEVDLNFMYRVPLWPVEQRDSRSIGAFRATAIPVLDIHELAAGKLTALFARRASRDLFDAHMLLTRESLDSARLRTAFVALGGMNRKDWRTIQLEDIGLETNEIRDQLLPVLRTAGQPGSKGPDEWGKTLVDECRTALSCLLPFTEPEKEFLDRLLDHGEISPSLITCDAALSERLARHPLLEWKALNVRRRRKNACP